MRGAYTFAEVCMSTACKCRRHFDMFAENCSSYEALSYPYRDSCANSRLLEI